MFLGEDLLAWLVLAIGAALAVGTTLALVRPRPDDQEGDLPRAPLGRSLVMITVGTLAASVGPREPGLVTEAGVAPVP